MNRQTAVFAVITVFFGTITAIMQVIFAPQIPYPVNLLLSILIVAVVVVLLIVAFGLQWLMRSRTLANFYRRPLLLILFYAAVEAMALYMIYIASYLYGLDVLAEKNNLNVGQIFHISVTGAQLYETLVFSIVEASVTVFVMTLLIGYNLYRLGIDRQRVIQHQ